jgi:hypothetical protein
MFVTFVSLMPLMYLIFLLDTDLRGIRIRKIKEYLAYTVRILSRKIEGVRMDEMTRGARKE